MSERSENAKVGISNRGFMKEYFNYPLDSKTLLRKKIQIKKELLSNSSNFIEKRIAVLGGSTTNEIVDQLELFLLNYGIKPTFYQSEYAQYWQDAMFGSEELDNFNPDIVYVHTNWRNIHYGKQQGRCGCSFRKYLSTFYSDVGQTGRAFSMSGYSGQF